MNVCDDRCLSITHMPSKVFGICKRTLTTTPALYMNSFYCELLSGEVRLQHARSHVLVPGNELADWLAEKGTHGETWGAMHGRWRGTMDATMAWTTRQGGAGRRQAPPTPSFLLGGQRWGGGGEG